MTYLHHFNTSYVVIKHVTFFTGVETGKDFNTSYVVIKLNTANDPNASEKFQYILCCY